jgi:hypothetical protein
MCDVDVIENSLELSTMMFVSTVFIKSGSFVKKKVALQDKYKMHT